jgi:rhamnopyranosyl-N-acetylglucosaminyl-diphospho-decaprenol beta-1,3/1,4-galactofuranosyltransferase
MPRIHIAILTFNNCPMLADLVRDIEKQTLQPAKVFVVDNASADETMDLMNASFPGISYERIPENTGSSGGYHRLLEIASPGSDFVWTLDDDVRIKPDALEKLNAGFENLNGKCRLGAVRSVGSWHHGNEPLPLNIVPWRGTLFSSAVIRQIGLPRKDYFLYGDDFEYSLRLKKYGYVCFWIPSSICTENRSSNKVRLRMFGKDHSIYATPYRHYYGFRNEISILIEYRNWALLATTLLYALKVIAGLSFSRLPGRNHLIIAALRGMVDGFSGKLGKNLRYVPHPESSTTAESGGLFYAAGSRGKQEGTAVP